MRTADATGDVSAHSFQSYGELLINALSAGDPEQPCLSSPDAAYSYGETLQYVAAWQSTLEPLGVGPSQGVAVLTRNRPEALLAIIATLGLGARYSPLHPLGSLEDHAFVARDSASCVLLFDDHTFADRAREVAAEMPQTAASVSLSDHGVLAPATDIPRVVARAGTPEDVAFLTYTGGTTGRPKGVMLTNRCMTSMVIGELAVLELPESPRFLAAAPVTHAAGQFLGPVLTRGGEFRMSPKFEPDAFLDDVESGRTNCTFLVPSMIYRLLDHPRTRSADLSGLETVVYGASPMSPSRLVEALDLFGDIFVQLYGQAEAPQLITRLSKRDHATRQSEVLQSAGYPNPGTTVSIRDSDGVPLPTGEVGELCVRGPVVMSGYWGLPDETAETLRGGWLHTGDLGRQASDGLITLVDRSKDMIVSGGFNVYAREVEDVLTAHSDVAAAAVIGVPDESWGEAVCAYVVAHSTPEDEKAERALVDELRAAVKVRRGSVHTPKQLFLVHELPLTSVGKPDKKALRAQFWAGSGRAVH